MKTFIVLLLYLSLFLFAGADNIIGNFAFLPFAAAAAGAMGGGGGGGGMPALPSSSATSGDIKTGAKSFGDIGNLGGITRGLSVPTDPLTLGILAIAVVAVFAFRR